MSRDEFLWVEKYRPRTIEDCILPDATKKTFKSFIDLKTLFGPKYIKGQEGGDYKNLPSDGQELLRFQTI